MWMRKHAVSDRRCWSSSRGKPAVAAGVPSPPQAHRPCRRVVGRGAGRAVPVGKRQSRLRKAAQQAMQGAVQADRAAIR